MISLRNDIICQGPVPKDFPGVSKYSKIRVCGCIPAVKMTNTNHIYLCKRWRFRPLVPVSIILVTVFFFVMTSIFLFPYYGFEGKIANGVSALLFLLFLTSYLQTICIGAGFYPFYWYQKQLEPNNELFSNHDDNSPSGIITTEEQYNWAKSKPRPPRSVISREAERIVLMPDHFCGVSSSYIGKRNLKFFTVFNLYAALFCGLLISYSLRLIIVQIRDHGWVWKFHFLFAFVTIIVGLQLGGMALMFFGNVCYNTVGGATTLEKSMFFGNTKERFDRGVKKNFEIIFGSWWCLPCWICPIGPFWCKTNDEIMEGEKSYYDDALFNQTEFTDQNTISV
ncbi:DHHC zinc finger domain containing protein [Tritrichomonas foetus]|uniref:Palmitoyltransferase n=1 Tax=Tritrichomonas foetus TaxID=1144522 RepID=A0A1J4K8X4_9EUKA|nr:DHHC zinc finger domain containing protein [Tritrichomonas foetus]|eukprot:OHT06126.1 DHHC zinc finger domain containing protein [Tritrichomonas foetus]